MSHDFGVCIKRLLFDNVYSMHPHRPIPLYSQPTQEDDVLVLSDGSYFPPIRKCNSMPDLPNQSVTSCPHSHYHPSANTVIILLDESLDFPPIRECNSTPDLPTQSVTSLRRSCYHPSPVQERQPEPQFSQLPRRSRVVLIQSTRIGKVQ